MEQPLAFAEEDQGLACGAPKMASVVVKPIETAVGNEKVNGYSSGDDSDVPIVRCKPSKWETGIVANRIDALEERVKFLETNVNVAAGVSLPRAVKAPLSELELEGFVDRAVGQGSIGNVGISRDFVRRFLQENFGIPDTSYYRRRVNALLMRKASLGDYKLEGRLFSLNF